MSDESEKPKEEVTLTTVMNRGREKAMGFFDHLEEMRWMLIKCLVVFLIFATLIGIYLQEFNSALLWPLHRIQAENPAIHLNLITTSVLGPFNVVINMCLLGGLGLSAPFMLFFIGRFVSPALNEKELKVVLPLCLAAFFLFLFGASFGFFVLMPGALRISLELSTLFQIEPFYTAESYFSMLSKLMLGVGATFEFPLVIILLVWLGVMSTAFLRKYRRHAIVVIAIIAAIVTPTPDPFNMLAMAAPLYVLFEISILISARVEKRRELRNR